MPVDIHAFGRMDFAIVTLAPVVVLFALGLALCVVTPLSVLVNLALAWQISSCSGDVFFAWHLVRAPRNSRIEDLGNTMVVHLSPCGFGRDLDASTQ